MALLICVLFVFALCERKNEKNKKLKYRSAEGKKRRLRKSCNFKPLASPREGTRCLGADCSDNSVVLYPSQLRTNGLMTATSAERIIV